MRSARRITGRAGIGNRSSSLASFLVAPDSFKGTFSAKQVAEALGDGLRRAGAAADLCPAADGARGAGAVLLDAMGGERGTAQVHDPLGRAAAAEYARIRFG